MATKTKSVRKSKVIKPLPEKIVNDAPRVFTDASWPVGSAAHQGDVILVRIEALPKSAKPRENRQVADGNTQGSRHILHGGSIYDCDLAHVEAAVQAVCPRAKLDRQCIGPVFTTDEVTALRHPEHGDHEYESGMTVAVVFQRNLDAMQRAVRSVD